MDVIEELMDRLIFSEDEAKAYVRGDMVQNYPVPATNKNACIAAPYRAVMPITKAFILSFKD